ncbi:MAG: T9SS C-terminal target domain-containing protein [Calditrichaeota bacterium]|nr:MAG: T9SS C-terminal target domain-containing protein [Calditrichota bacterium]
MKLINDAPFFNIFCVSILLFIGYNCTQVQAEIPTRSANLVTDFSGIKNTMPGRESEGFVPPTDDELANWRIVIQTMLAEDWDGAHALIQQNFPMYSLFRYTDTGNADSVYYLLKENSPVNKGWGTYVFAKGYQRQLVIEAPHPWYDTNTYKQAPDVFRLTGARYLIMAGTHRCANNEISGCDGTSGSCGGPYKISDMAHSVHTFFHVTHEEIVAFNARTYQVQLHGHSQSTCEDIFLSNGHRTSVSDELLALRDQVLLKGGLTCNVAGLSQCGLVASSNVQGRYTNGVKSDPCNTYASSGNITEYFIHAEQTRTVRDNPGQYKKFTDALNTVIPLAANQTAVHSDNAKEPAKSFRLLNAYPNPFNPATTITFELQQPVTVSLQIYNEKGQRIRELVRDKILSPGSHSYVWNGRKNDGEVVASGLYLVQLNAGHFQETKKVTFAK